MSSKDSLKEVQERERMVQEQIIDRGIKSQAVLSSMRRVPRHLFVPKEIRHLSYSDQALPLGISGSTISQPFVVALMLELADIQEGDKVFELGCGSGYTSALLAEMGAVVYGMDVEQELVSRAKENLIQWNKDKAEKVRLKCGDGRLGWAEFAPYDKIIVSAAFSSIPRELIKQLNGKNGRMIIPIGHPLQQCALIKKDGDKLRESLHGQVAFVAAKG